MSEQRNKDKELLRYLFKLKLEAVDLIDDKNEGAIEVLTSDKFNNAIKMLVDRLIKDDY